MPAVRRWVGRRPGSPAELTAGGQLLALLGLTGFAIAQPLLALLGDEPTWFTIRGASRADIVAFALIVGVGAPLVLWGVGRVLRKLSLPLGRGFHLVVVMGLAGIAALRALRAIDALSAAVAILAAALVGLAFAIAYVAWRPVRQWVQYTCVLPVLAVGTFLLASPTGELVTQRAAATTASSSTSDAPSVLFLMLDELPTSALLDASGEIDAVRFPNLAELADDGELYPSYTTQSVFTVTAVPSILSGKRPTADPPIFTRHPDNLFSLLAPTHDLHVVETVTELCDPKLCHPDRGARSATAILRDLMADGASAYGERLVGRSTRDPFEDVELDLQSTLYDQLAAEYRGVQRRPRVLNELLRTIERVDEPALWFAHLMLPHQPWGLYPDGSTYDRADFRSENSADPWLRAIAEQRLLLQLQYTDALVGDALDALRAAGEYDDAVVVVTADHGVSLLPGTHRRQIDEDSLEPLAYAPLIIKGPQGRQPERDGSNVISADLLPTIAALTGVDVPWDLAGHAIGSDEQRSRGRTKEVYDFGSGSSPAYEGTHRFEQRPAGALHEHRVIGSLRPGDGPIAGLLAPLHVERWLGRSIDEQAEGEVATVAAIRHGVDHLEDPGTSPPGVALVSLQGDVDADDIVLLEVDGAVVTAAPVRLTGAGRGSADVFLPPGALDATGNEIDLALLRGGHVLRLSG